MEIGVKILHMSCCRCLETTQAVDIESCLVSYVEGQLKCKIPIGKDINSDGVCNTADQFGEYERIYRIIQGKRNYLIYKETSELKGTANFSRPVTRRRFTR